MNRHPWDQYISRDRREEATGLPPMTPHATDATIPAVAAAIAKRERKSGKLDRDAARSRFNNDSHPDNQ